MPPRFRLFVPFLIAGLAGAVLLASPGPGRAQSGDRQGSLDALARLNAVTGGQPSASCAGQRMTLAEQILRLHTELMVTSLACAEAYGDADLYQRYRQFTVDHADAMRDSQAEITRRFGSGEPAERQFDLFRTEMANAESQTMQRVSTPVYCAMRQSRFRSLIGATPQAFSGYAGELVARADLRSGC